MERCPVCEIGIEKELFHQVYGLLMGDFFEFVCPNCETTLEIEVIPIPEFNIVKKAGPDSQ